MRVDFGAKPMLYPMPVLILGTYDENGTPNAMNAAWGGISEEKEISICISKDHKTTENLLKRKAFTVSVATVEERIPTDYVGIVSGNDTRDKIRICGWTAESSKTVHAPLFQELPFALECRLLSYDQETCRLVGEIVNVSVDESILTDGKIDLSKFHPICYDPANHSYLSLGSVVGRAFSDGKQLNQ